MPLRSTVWFCCQCGCGPSIVVINAYCPFCHCRRCRRCRIWDAKASSDDQFISSQPVSTSVRPKLVKTTPECRNMKDPAPPNTTDFSVLPYVEDEDVHGVVESDTRDIPLTLSTTPVGQSTKPGALFATAIPKFRCYDDETKYAAERDCPKHAGRMPMAGQAASYRAISVGSDSTEPSDHEQSPAPSSRVSTEPSDYEQSPIPSSGVSADSPDYEQSPVPVASVEKESQTMSWMTSLNGAGPGLQPSTKPSSGTLPASSSGSIISPTIPRLSDPPRLQTLLDNSYTVSADRTAFISQASVDAQVSEFHRVSEVAVGYGEATSVSKRSQDRANRLDSDDFGDLRRRPRSMSTSMLIECQNSTYPGDRTVCSSCRRHFCLRSPREGTRGQLIQNPSLFNSGDQARLVSFKVRAQHSPEASETASNHFASRLSPFSQNLTGFRGTHARYLEDSRVYRTISEPPEPIEGLEGVGEESKSGKRTQGQRRRRNAVQKHLSLIAELAEGDSSPLCATTVFSSRSSRQHRGFGCPFYKDEPRSHAFEACAAWFSAQEEQVRLEHVDWHFQQGHLSGVIDATLLMSELRELPNSLSHLLASLPRQREKEALWQATTVRLFEKYHRIKHLLNPYAFHELLDNSDRWGFWFLSSRLHPANYNDPEPSIDSARRLLSRDFTPGLLTPSPSQTSRASSVDQNSLGPWSPTEQSNGPYQITLRRDGSLPGGSTQDDVIQMRKLADEFLLKIQPILRGSATVDIRVFEQPENRFTASSEHMLLHPSRNLLPMSGPQDFTLPESNISSNAEHAPRQLRAIAPFPTQRSGIMSPSSTTSYCSSMASNEPSTADRSHRPVREPSLKIIHSSREATTTRLTLGSSQTTSEVPASNQLPNSLSQPSIPQLPALTDDAWNDLIESEFESLHIDPQSSEDVHDSYLTGMMSAGNLPVGVQAGTSFASEVTDVLQSDQYYGLDVMDSIDEMDFDT